MNTKLVSAAMAMSLTSALNLGAATNDACGCNACPCGGSNDVAIDISFSVDIGDETEEEAAARLLSDAAEA